MEEANRRAQELELGLAAERAAREADKLAQEKKDGGHYSLDAN